ncbi:MAG: transposase [Caldisericota bacterium]|nr:transposase [Caldisericota bacterium]
MGREKRTQLAGGIYHIISKGNTGKKIFINDIDRTFFLKNLAKNSNNFDTMIFSYVLMSNHYHILLRTNKNNLSDFMHRLNTIYSHRFNYMHGLTGHLFHDRYKSFLVEDDQYFVAAMRYIAINPVAAGVVEKAEKYEWGSYRYLFEEDPYPWLHIREALSLVDMSVRDFVKISEKKIDSLEFKKFEAENDDMDYKEIIRYMEVVREHIGDLSDNTVLRNSLIYFLYQAGFSKSDIGRTVGISRRGVYRIAEKVSDSIERGDRRYINAISRINSVNKQVSVTLVPGTSVTQREDKG